MRSLGRDLFASVVVFLVALPLCLGIAVASGVPAIAGLITGIVGGIVVGVLAGSPLQVSGPAAGLTVLVLEIVRQHGMPALAVIVLLAGILQIIAGVLRLGQWFRAVSPSVIHGMLSGIGVLIFASQFHVMVDDKPKSSGLENLRTIPEAIKKGLPLPTLEPRETRKLRATFLREVGSLHELQSEIAALANSGPGGRQAPLAEAQLASMVERQQKLNQALDELGARLAATDLHSIDEDESDVPLALTNAKKRAAAAAVDLSSGDSARIAESQANSKAALESLATSLKQHDWAAKIGLLTIAVIVGWQAFVPKQWRLLPGPLVAVVLATTVTVAFDLPILCVELPERVVDGIAFLQWNTLPGFLSGAILVKAVMIAIIASAETLLCATAVDQMHTGPRTKYDKELFAQGVGNAICGIFGALPMTGVIVRSAANVQAGATSRASTILHGIWLLLFTLVFAFILQFVPMAALAGILVYTGYRLIAPHTIAELWKISLGEVAVFLITVATIVATDLLTGVLVGVALSLLKLAYVFSHLQTHLHVSEDKARALLALEGAATFIRLPKLAAALEDVPPAAELHVDFEHLDYIDHACLDLLMSWAKQHEATGGRLIVDWGSLHARFRREDDRPNAPNHDRSLEKARTIFAAANH